MSTACEQTHAGPFGDSELLVFKSGSSSNNLVPFSQLKG